MLQLTLPAAMAAVDLDQAFKATVALACAAVFVLFLYFFLSQVLYITWRIAVLSLLLLGVAHLVHLNHTYQLVSPERVAALRALATDALAWLVPSMATASAPPPPPPPASLFASLFPFRLW